MTDTLWLNHHFNGPLRYDKTEKNLKSLKNLKHFYPVLNKIFLPCKLIRTHLYKLCPKPPELFSLTQHLRHWKRKGKKSQNISLVRRIFPPTCTIIVDYQKLSGLQCSDRKLFSYETVWMYWGPAPVQIKGLHPQEGISVKIFWRNLFPLRSNIFFSGTTHFKRALVYRKPKRKPQKLPPSVKWQIIYQEYPYPLKSFFPKLDC